MAHVSQIPTICHPSCLFENPLPWPIYCLGWMRWGDASFSDQDTYHLVNSNLDHVIVIKLFRERTWAHPFTPSPFHSLENLHTYHRLKSIPHWSEHVYHMGKWHECKIESSWLKNSLYLKRSHKYETVRHDAMLSKSINCTNCVVSLWTSWRNQGRRSCTVWRIPIIVMTAQDEVPVIMKCSWLGAADYLATGHGRMPIQIWLFQFIRKMSLMLLLIALMLLLSLQSWISWNVGLMFQELVTWRTGQLLSGPRKNELKVGESSTFFTYV